MAKKKETFSFIETPLLYEAATHTAFTHGKKSDYVVQVVPMQAMADDDSKFYREHGVTDALAIVHMPGGVLGAAPFRAAETDTIATTTNPIVGAELWLGEKGIQGPHGHYVRFADGGRYNALRRRRAKRLRVKVQKPFQNEAVDLAIETLRLHKAGELKQEPYDIPLRRGRTWLWSASWRDLYAPDNAKVRPQSLSTDGAEYWVFTPRPSSSQRIE